MDAQPFDPEGVVCEYRFAHDAGDSKVCQTLRGIWKEWQGEDSLHEMAYGEPVSADALSDRRKRLREWLGTVRPNQVQAVRAQLAWLETIETV
jgi:hypothetical protein